MILKTVKNKENFPLNFGLHFELALLADSYDVESDPVSRSPEPIP